MRATYSREPAGVGARLINPPQTSPHAAPSWAIR
ncbi:hypothetical protein DJ62_1044 [Yersinia enterocolitica]|nr:hypothetical protein DJ62_1044 [Yersinia enterocolitica]